MERDDIETLTRIDTNVQSLMKRFEDVTNDHEKRLRKVERKQWYHTGGLAVVGVLVAKLGLPWPSIG